jgi:hypothetical protein
MKTYVERDSSTNLDRRIDSGGQAAQLQIAPCLLLADNGIAPSVLHANEELANGSPRATQLKEREGIVAASPAAAPSEHFQRLADCSHRTAQLMQHAQPTQQAAKPNLTGLPDGLKSSIESLSGLSMDYTKVHYNSVKPAQMHAHAYAQGSEIHVAPGQERYLAHEAWHIVQQAQGRVRSTGSIKGTAINDNFALEQEADLMGERALQQTQTTFEKNGRDALPCKQVSKSTPVVQCVMDLNLSDIHVRIENSASKHMTEDEVFAVLRRSEITGEILQAEVSNTLKTWNAMALEADNGYRLLCTWRNGMLCVFHSDKGDKYREENRKINVERFNRDDKNDKDSEGRALGPKSNVYDPSTIPEGYDY